MALRGPMNGIEQIVKGLFPSPVTISNAQSGKTYYFLHNFLVRTVPGHNYFHGTKQDAKVEA